MSVYRQPRSEPTLQLIWKAPIEILEILKRSNPGCYVNKAGSGGHTALVLQAPGPSAQTIGCNRNMPETEGLGLESQELPPKAGRTYLFFQVKDPEPTLLHAKECVKKYTIQPN